MRDVSTWPSLTDQLTLASTMYGATGQRLVDAWLDRECSRIGNIDFAREFADHICLPGVSTLDYAHRYVRSRHGDAIGGIRFYNRNVNRPFVEIIAHSFQDRSALTACVQSEWSMFDVRYLHLRSAPGRIRGDNTILDQTIHVGRYRYLRDSDDQVRLEDFPTANDAIDLIAQRYQHLTQSEPQLAHNICAAHEDDIRSWHRTHQLKAICANDGVVGALAIAPGSIGWIFGDEINEEVVITAHCGHGYAASAQSAWAASIGQPDQFLCGTIDRHNHSSRRTAEKAGRPAVLEDTFVALKA